MNTDRITVQMVVGFLGLSSLLIIGGLIALAFVGRPIPDQLSTLGGATLGALGSLLARTSTSERRPGESRLSEPSMAIPVEVRNSASQPVPVAQAEVEEDE